MLTSIAIFSPFSQAINSLHLIYMTNNMPPSSGQSPQPSQATQTKSNKLLIWLTNSKPWLITIVLLLALVWLVKNLFFSSTAISVVGVGEMSVEPAAVEMLITRVDSNPDPVVAVSQSEDQLAAILSEAKRIAGNNLEIQKSFYQVTPTVVGGDVIYQVANVIKITAADPALASDLIKSLYGVGATTISNVNFIPADQDQVTQEVRKAAMQDARQQAKSMARASGKRVGRMVSISDDLAEAGGTVSSDDQTTTDLAAELGSSITATPSKIDVSKSVTVTYYLW